MAGSAACWPAALSVRPPDEALDGSAESARSLRRLATRRAHERMGGRNRHAPCRALCQQRGAAAGRSSRACDALGTRGQPLWSSSRSARYCKRRACVQHVPQQPLSTEAPHTCGSEAAPQAACLVGKVHEQILDRIHFGAIIRFAGLYLRVANACRGCRADTLMSVARVPRVLLLAPVRALAICQ